MNVNELGGKRLAPAGYVRVKIRNRAILVKTLIDSGNLADDIISEDLSEALGLKLKEVTGVIGTAAAGGSLKIVGRAGPITIYLEGITYPCVIRPYVLRGMNHAMNLGNKFLREIR